MFANLNSGRVSTPPLPPKITSRVQLAIAIGSDEPKTLTLGLYDNDAPQSVKLFRGLCGGGELPSTLSYRGSTVTRIEKGKSIVLGHLSAGSAQTIVREVDATGYVRSTLVNLADDYTTTDANALFKGLH